jgi:hypothetical protein
MKRTPFHDLMTEANFIISGVWKTRSTAPWQAGDNAQTRSASNSNRIARCAYFSYWPFHGRRSRISDNKRFEDCGNPYLPHRCKRSSLALSSQ